jgi:hypothetical protein
MTKENTLDNIFTDFDESIFSDGSIDPMGLRIIWTSIGSKIFHNKLNTISTDIKFYTLNLFHHYLLQKCISEDEDSVNKLIRKKPYYNKSDLFEGLVIFLENLLTNATYNVGDSSLMVPGKNKLGNLKRNDAKKQTVEKISVNRDKGILVRQYLLGIHGRHKGPFQQMGVFNENAEDCRTLPPQIPSGPGRSRHPAEAGHTTGRSKRCADRRVVGIRLQRPHRVRGGRSNHLSSRG